MKNSQIRFESYRNLQNLKFVYKKKYLIQSLLGRPKGHEQESSLRKAE